MFENPKHLLNSIFSRVKLKRNTWRSFHHLEIEKKQIEKLCLFLFYLNVAGGCMDLDARLGKLSKERFGRSSIYNCVFSHA